LILQLCSVSLIISVDFCSSHQIGLRAEPRGGIAALGAKSQVAQILFRSNVKG